MSSEDSTFWPYFYEIFDSMPRQGPGDDDSTRRALDLCPPLDKHHRILDLGCGSGTQTLQLAHLSPAQIVAVDSHAPFISQLRSRSSASGFGDRIAPQVGDMHALPFGDGSFDLIWSEGAIFIIGFARGLKEWRRLIAPGGHLVVSEMCWFRDTPAPELADYFAGHGAEVASVASRTNTIAESGYRLIADFQLPAKGWWDNYYVPLARLLKPFRNRHEGNPDALAVASLLEREIEVYQRHPGEFGYAFFVMTPQ